MVKTLSFQYRDMGSIPGLEIKILHATHSSKKKKKKSDSNKKEVTINGTGLMPSRPSVQFSSVQSLSGVRLFATP